jgi:hypothetical protein
VIGSDPNKHNPNTQFMGLFNIFHTIGSGLSKAYDSVAKPVYNSVIKPAYTEVIKPVFNSVIKPVYNKVIKPVGEGALRIGGKALSTGETFVEGGMDFSGQFVDKARGGVLNVEDGALNITKLLSNPFVMIGAGILGLVVVSKI